VRLLSGLAALWIGMYVVSGIRPYYALFIWAAAAGALSIGAATQRLRRLPAFVAGAATILVLFWGAFMLGSGPEFYAYYTGRLQGIVARAIPSTAETPASTAASPGRLAGSVISELDEERGRFVDRPGATNVVLPSSRDTTVTARVRAAATGILLLFVPASLVLELSSTDFTIGRGLLFITDVDTVVQDLLLVAVIAVLLRERTAARENLPFIVFAALLACVVALSLAYVVVNYGTLIRLRLIVAVPLWMLALAASNRQLTWRTG
jgi:hypothetical protein